MVIITPSIVIPESELAESFVRSPGPGGQNVNKVSTAVDLRFDIGASVTLAAAVKERLYKKYASRISAEGVLAIRACRFRTQERNRDDARERLAELVRAVLVVPKRRVATKPTKASRTRRIEGKRRHAAVKAGRRPNDIE